MASALMPGHIQTNGVRRTVPCNELRRDGSAGCEVAGADHHREPSPRELVGLAAVDPEAVARRRIRYRGLPRTS
jgi:hypothetical protein